MVRNPSCRILAPNRFTTVLIHSADQIPLRLYPGSLMIEKYGNSTPLSRHLSMIAKAHSTYSSGLSSVIHASSVTGETKNVVIPFARACSTRLICASVRFHSKWNFVQSKAAGSTLSLIGSTPPSNTGRMRVRPKSVYRRVRTFSCAAAGTEVEPALLTCGSSHTRLDAPNPSIV